MKMSKKKSVGWLSTGNGEGSLGLLKKGVKKVLNFWRSVTVSAPPAPTTVSAPPAPAPVSITPAPAHVSYKQQTLQNERIQNISV